jgi:hypothetical protein
VGVPFSDSGGKITDAVGVAVATKITVARYGLEWVELIQVGPEREQRFCQAFV